MIKFGLKENKLKFTPDTVELAKLSKYMNEAAKDFEKMRTSAGETRKEYDRMLGDLSVMSGLAGKISKNFSEGGRSLLGYLQAGLDVIMQIARLHQKGDSKEGIGFGDVLGFITSILPFFFLGSGGRVPGYGLHDTIPAWLTPGEFVVRKDIVKKYGEDFFHNLNEGATLSAANWNRYNQGGMVRGSGMPNITVIVQSEVEETKAVKFFQNNYPNYTKVIANKS
jgi:hypothetical protein